MRGCVEVTMTSSPRRVEEFFEAKKAKNRVGVKWQSLLGDAQASFCKMPRVALKCRQTMSEDFRVKEGLRESTVIIAGLERKGKESRLTR